MKLQHLKPIAQNITLLLGSLIFTLIVIEIGFRVLDPTPFFSDSEINNTEHGNLSVRDDILGWKGVPSGKIEFVTRNNRVWLAHNRHGFRDIEHYPLHVEKPAIVFLGDSFTWGYEVEFDEMFVNRLRDRLPRHEIFNLAHRGYGTDQALLTFKQWSDKRALGLVVLMFSENDMKDNNSAFNYGKPKSRYQLRNNELILTGVPVAKDDSWLPAPDAEGAPDSRKITVKNLVYSSHFINNMRIRYKLFRERKRLEQTQDDAKRQKSEPDYALTARILEELRNQVMRRGSRLVVVFIPSKREIDELDESVPYQTALAGLCEKLGIEYLDLAPDLKKAFFRTYYRQGMHWNPHGHKIAAEALYDYLAKQLTP
jgi:lysophospholipase L1-like esterase